MAGVSLVTNIDAIVASGLAGMPGTVSARLEGLRDQRGRRAPLEDAAALEELLRAAAPAADGIRFEPVDLANPGAVYLRVIVPMVAGGAARARLVWPRGAGYPPAPGAPAQGGGAVPHAGEAVPLAFLFPDAGRPVRGWHHLARFSALGFAVLALDAGVVDPAPEGAAAAFPGLARQALALAQAGLGLAGVDAARVCTWGEGVGGALAIVVAAALPGRVAKCAACGPYPLDDPALPAHVDAVCLAPRLRSELLVGTPLLDALASAEAQAALVNRAGAGPCAARQVVYPKFAHERINDFEDEVLEFLRFEYHGAGRGLV